MPLYVALILTDPVFLLAARGCATCKAGLDFNVRDCDRVVRWLDEGIEGNE